MLGHVQLEFVQPNCLSEELFHLLETETSGKYPLPHTLMRTGILGSLISYPSSHVVQRAYIENFSATERKTVINQYFYQVHCWRYWVGPAEQHVPSVGVW